MRLRCTPKGRVLSESIFPAAGLGFSSTSYAGNPGKLALAGNFLGCVRNIRVKNSKSILFCRKSTCSRPPKNLSRNAADRPTEAFAGVTSFSPYSVIAYSKTICIRSINESIRPIVAIGSVGG